MQRIGAVTASGAARALLFLAALLLPPDTAGVLHGATAEPVPSTPQERNAQATLSDPKDGEAADEDAVTVASWGGAYGESQEIALFEPFRRSTGQAVNLVAHGGHLATIKRRLAADPAPWDLVDLSSTMLDIACREGLIDPIDSDALAASADGTPAAEDFLKGGLHECGVASVAWSAVVVYDPTALDGRTPRAVSDLLDLKAFPGKRALPKGPRYTLEIALLADGVRPERVYPLLETDAGVERALKALDRIKRQIVWWTGAQEPIELLASGRATLALSFNARAFDAMVRRRQPLSFLWDGQIYDVNAWAIPKNARRKDAARKLIAFATRPAALAAQSRWFPYGPMRRSALASIGRHAQVNIDMAEFLPTAPGHLDKALRFGGDWWQEHEERLTAAYETWLARPETPPEPVFDPEIAPEE